MYEGVGVVVAWGEEKPFREFTDDWQDITVKSLFLNNKHVLADYLTVL